MSGVESVNAASRSLIAPRRPKAEHDSDVVPEPIEFAGWPAAGPAKRALAMGPVAISLEGLGADEEAALALLAGDDDGAPEGADDAPVDPLALRLETTRSERASYLARRPGERLRLACWREGEALAMVTHEAALLLDPQAGNGLLVLARQSPESLAMSLQNVLRVATAWRLAAAGRGLLLHAAAVALPRDDGEEAALLVGPSGAGKTTALGLAAPAVALSDDVAVLEAPGGERGPRWRVHETPAWADLSRRPPHGRGRVVPLGVACRLEKSSTPRRTRLGRAAATAALEAHAPFGQVELIPSDGASALELARAVPVERLEFTKTTRLHPLLESCLAGVSGNEVRP